MADRILGYGPQGFALEVNPWQTEQLLNALLLYRGAIVAGWANVETSLIEIAIRASIHEAYSAKAGKYPKRHNDRIAFLRAILELPGPLRSYSKLGTAVLNRFDNAAEIRNVMAHGRMTLLLNRGATFHIFTGKTGSSVEIIQRRLRYSEKQLSEFAKRATLFSRAIRMLVAQIDARKLLPPLSAAE